MENVEGIFSLTVKKTENGGINIVRHTEGFNIFEVLGLLENVKFEVMNELKKIDKQEKL